MNFLAISHGVHLIDTLTLTDIETGISTNLRLVFEFSLNKLAPQYYLAPYWMWSCMIQMTELCTSGNWGFTDVWCHTSKYVFLMDTFREYNPRISTMRGEKEVHYLHSVTSHVDDLHNAVIQITK